MTDRDGCVFQDGSERGLESLSLIDAVMPDVVDSRKQAAKTHVKAESTNTNGEEVSHTVCEYTACTVHPRSTSHYRTSSCAIHRR